MTMYILTDRADVLAGIAGKPARGGRMLSLPRDGGGYLPPSITAPDGARWVQVVDGCPASYAVCVLLPDDDHTLGEARAFFSVPSAADLAAAQLPGCDSAPRLLRDDEVAVARIAGYALHHEVDFTQWGDDLLDTTSDWYAASHAWVADYLAGGGQWAYTD